MLPLRVSHTVLRSSLDHIQRCRQYLCLPEARLEWWMWWCQAQPVSEQDNNWSVYKPLCKEWILPTDTASLYTALQWSRYHCNPNSSHQTQAPEKSSGVSWQLVISSLVKGQVLVSPVLVLSQSSSGSTPSHVLQNLVLFFFVFLPF